MFFIVAIILIIQTIPKYDHFCMCFSQKHRMLQEGSALSSWDRMNPFRRRHRTLVILFTLYEQNEWYNLIKKTMNCLRISVPNLFAVPSHKSFCLYHQVYKSVIVFLICYIIRDFFEDGNSSSFDSFSYFKVSQLLLQDSAYHTHSCHRK